MNDLPDFESAPPAQPAPKKPRRKPMKKHAARKVKTLRPPKKVPVKRRKRRAAKSPALAAPYKGGMLADAVYEIISRLMGMKHSERAIVIDLAQRFSK